MNKIKSKISVAFFIAALSLIAAQGAENPANTWTWMKGATITNQHGSYGTQGMPDPANTPGARYCSVSWTDNSGAMWLFGGYGYAASISAGQLNDLWKFDPVTTNWTWMKGTNTTTGQKGTYGTRGVADPANTPGPRHDAISWTDNSGALWLFGGYGDDSIGGAEDYLNDLWKYDPATGNWTWMKGANTKAQPGTYGTQGVPDPANTPGARSSAIAWTDGSGALWLFGGTGYPASGNEGWLNDLWKYDPATGNWTWMKGANITNQHGTYGTQGVPDPANTPGARYRSVSWTDGSGALWLFGGEGYPASGSDGWLNDLWKYDPATGNWTWMKGANTRGQFGTYGTQGVPDPANTPGVRYNAISWTDGVGALWLFGGYGYSASGMGRLNDLWKYNPSSMNWTWIKGATNANQSGTYGTQGMADPPNTPGAREGSIAWTDNSGALWLFGGQGFMPSFGGGFFNDLWKYNSGGWISCADIDGDGIADLVTVIGSNWYAWFSTSQYLVRCGPYDLDISGASLTGDIDGDGLADLITVVSASGGWYVWFSTSQYQVRCGPYDMGISGTPVTGDIDGDRLADLIVVSASGGWYVWFSTSQYQVRCGPYDMGISGTPVTGDIDGDRLADLITVVGSNWYVWFSTSQYQVRCGPYTLSAP